MPKRTLSRGAQGLDAFAAALELLGELGGLGVGDGGPVLVRRLEAI